MRRILPELFVWIERVMDANNFLEVIFVNDGSIWSTRMIGTVGEKSEHVRGTKFRRNYGKSPAPVLWFQTG